MVVVIEHLAVLMQFLLFLRLDGYYVVSDFIGVPDLFGRIKPVFSGLLRVEGTGAGDPTPAARATVVAWVVVTVPLLAGALALFVLPLARVSAVAQQALLTHAGLVRRSGDVATVVLSSLQIVVLIVPILGFVLLVHRSLRRRRRLAGGRVREASRPT